MKKYILKVWLFTILISPLLALIVTRTDMYAPEFLALFSIYIVIIIVSIAVSFPVIFWLKFILKHILATDHDLETRKAAFIVATALTAFTIQLFIFILVAGLPPYEYFNITGYLKVMLGYMLFPPLLSFFLFPKSIQ